MRSFKNNKDYSRSINFIYKYLDNKNLFTTTKKLGKEVYNIKTPNFKQDLGYIGYLKNTSNFFKLLDYLEKLANIYNLNNYILIIIDTSTNIKYYYKGYKGIVDKEATFSTRKDIRKEFIDILTKEGFKFNKSI